MPGRCPRRRAGRWRRFELVDFDEATLDALKRRAKKQLRQRMRALRGVVPAAARSSRSAAIVDRLLSLPELAGARTIGLFWPMEGRSEVDLGLLDASCRERGATVCYPFIRDGDEGRSTGFSPVSAPSDLVDAGHGFLEPPATAPACRPGELEVIVVPALAVSEQGHRLGYGSGFYDEILPRFRPPALAIVVAYDFQLLAELPSTPHDVPCDIVITDARTIRV